MPVSTKYPRSSIKGPAALLFGTCCLALAASSGCGYTTRPGLPSNIHTVYIKPFLNKINVTMLSTSDGRFPIYRHRREVDVTNAVITRFQFTGLLRPTSVQHADLRLEGEVVDFRRDALRYDSNQQVEEWRLNVVINMRCYDQATQQLIWQEDRFTGDATYFATGSKSESETAALDRAITDLARRVVERTVENW